MPAHKNTKEEPRKTEAAKKKESNKGKEKWRHKVVAGKSHPDHNPPVTIIGTPSDENVKKYEDSINAEREKVYGDNTPDWRDLEGGVPQEEPKDAPAPKFPKGPADAKNP